MIAKSKFLLPLSALGLVLGMAGCNERPEQPEVKARDVQEKVSQAAQTTAQYANQKKDEFIQSMEQNLAALKQQIDELGAKSQTLTAEAKEEAQQTQAKLQDQYDKLKTKMTSLRDSSQESWESIKDGFAKGLDDLQQAVKEAKAKFNS